MCARVHVGGVIVQKKVCKNETIRKSGVLNHLSLCLNYSVSQKEEVRWWHCACVREKERMRACECSRVCVGM